MKLFNDDGTLRVRLSDLRTGNSFVNDMSIIYRLWKQGDISKHRWQTLSVLCMYRYKYRSEMSEHEFDAEFNRFSCIYSDDMKEAYFYIANANTEAFKRIFLEDEWKRIEKTAHHLKFANPFVKSFCYNN